MASQLKLVADRTGRDLLKCLITSAHVGAKVGVLASAKEGVCATPERPALILPTGCLFSASAICKYLISSTGQQTAKGALLPQGGVDRWNIEEWLGWTSRSLQPALEANVKKDVDLALSHLEASIKSDFLAKSFSLADIFVFAAIFKSQVGESGLSRYPKVTAWITRIKQLPAVLAAISEQTGAAHPAVKGSPAAAPAPPPSQPQAPVQRKPLSKRTQYAITTAINYTNGPPHMGHAYEAITADVIARYHRVFGRQVFFLTGTDEHGQKIATSAEKEGKTPIELCDKYAAGFQALNKRLNISNDFYVRTTMDKHKKACQLLWKKAKEHGDIYLGNYEGWYNVREEAFVTENEAKATDYKDPTSGLPLKRMQEASYFFRMSKYQERLVEFIKANPNFIQPEFRRNDILTRLQEPLTDLSVSRTTFSWGVPVPDDPAHVMYVWFDALTNYVSGMDYPKGPNSHFWPAQVHIIGKDIIWFHCVIWPCMLMSTGIPLPETVFAHGFVNDADGRKMSKSLGNVVDPNHLLETIPADSFRFFLLRTAAYGEDIPFSAESMIVEHNCVLCDYLGNLVHRATNLCSKYCDGVVPSVPALSFPFDIEDLRLATDEAYESFKLQEAIELVVRACQDTNKFLQDQAPWALKEASDRPRQQQTIKAVLEGIYVLAHFFEPVIPNACAEIFKKLNTPKRAIKDLSSGFDNLKAGTPVSIGGVLFEKFRERTAEFPFQKVELRVGKIKTVKNHKDAKLYTLTVATSDKDADDRQIVAFIREAYTPEQLEGKQVLVVCNMKPQAVKGEKSHGLVLAADGPDGKTTLLSFGEAAGVEVAVGSLVEAEGYPPVLKKADNITKKDWDAMEFKSVKGVVHLSVTLSDKKDKSSKQLSLPLVALQGQLKVKAAAADGSSLAWK